MSRFVAILGILLLGTATLAAQGNQRVWRDTSGNTLSAKFLWADAEFVYLKLPTGKERKYELGLLSNDDLEYVRAFRDKLKAKGIVYEAPLVWEAFRAKDFTAAEARKAGYYPLDDRRNSSGKLELEFRRFGRAAAPTPGQRLVLRMSTAARRDSGTKSRILVTYRGKVVGRGTNVPSGATFDIPLAPDIIAGEGVLAFTLTCGSDTVHLRTGTSGAGPRLLVVEQKP